MIPKQKLFTRGDMRGMSKPPKVVMPLCKNCSFFKSGNCSKFVYINLVDGKESNVPATEARLNFEMCGVGASHFKQLVVQRDTDDDIVNMTTD